MDFLISVILALLKRNPIAKNEANKHAKRGWKRRARAFSFSNTVLIIALLFLFLLAALILALMGIQPLPRLLLAGAVLALVYYVVVFILVVRCIRKAAEVIAAISE